MINFANPDMVGHTGVMNATVTAVEATDVALGIVLDAIEKRGGVALITCGSWQRGVHGRSGDRARRIRRTRLIRCR